MAKLSKECRSLKLTPGKVTQLTKAWMTSSHMLVKWPIFGGLYHKHNAMKFWQTARYLPSF